MRWSWTHFPLATLLLLAALLLPVSMARASHDVGPDRVYFHETGHTLQHGFLNHWRHHGGLPIYGYPVTEEFAHPETGVITQYFERAVYEWHPGNPPEWQVLLHRLGAEISAGRQHEGPFQPTAPSTTPACTYYDATGHNLCHGFRDYWNTYGGLPVFGYPLSAEFSENGRIVQYFERARFEWHPENAGTVYEVLLGRLGADKAQRLSIDTSAVSQPNGVPTYHPDLWHVPAPVDLVEPSGFMLEMQADLEAAMRWWDGHNAVSVTDLQTGQTVSVNGNRPQPAACTIKIPLMMAVSQDIHAGLYTHASIADTVFRTMGPSTTPPARELTSLIGGNSVERGIHRINQIMQDTGMSSSVLMHPPGFPHEEYGYAEQWGRKDNLLTTNDLNRLLSALYHRQALSPAETDYVLWSMTLGTPGQQHSLGGPLPGWVTLYHKIGLIYEPYNTWNDAGIVVFERDGQQYAYAISWLGSFGGDSWLTAHDRGAVVSGIAWRYFSAHYQ
jgi:hypothetical protein